MLDRFSITDEDWQQTPASVQTAFTSLYHQLLMLELRSEVYERQLAELRQQICGAHLSETFKQWLVEVKSQQKLGRHCSNRRPRYSSSGIKWAMQG